MNHSLHLETNSEDPEMTLALGDLRLVVARVGASLRGFYRVKPDGGRLDFATRYSGRANKIGSEGDVLIPFPGRVAGGRYTFEGQEYQMPGNDKDGPNALHGFMRAVTWDLCEVKESEASFTAELPNDQITPPGYPFRLRASVTYRLVGGGMECDFEIENIGAGAAPVAAGFHPYFTVGTEFIDTTRLQVAMASYQEFDSGLIPTGNILPVDGSEFDFRKPRDIGETVFNTCFVNPIRDPDGRVRIQMRNPDSTRRIAVWMDRRINYVVLYTADTQVESHRRRVLAIEPMTCGADAFNHPEWGLAILQPGEKLSGAWGVEVS